MCPDWIKPPCADITSSSLAHHFLIALPNITSSSLTRVSSFEPFITKQFREKEYFGSFSFGVEYFGSF